MKLWSLSVNPLLNSFAEISPFLNFAERGTKIFLHLPKKLSQIRYQYPFTRKEKSEAALKVLREQLSTTTPVFNKMVAGGADRDDIIDTHNKHFANF